MRCLFIALAIVSLWSCTNDRAGILEQEIKLLKQQSARKDSALQEFVRIFNRVGDNLSLIHQTRSSIDSTLKKGQLTKQKKEIILSQINRINILMEQNRNMIDSLHGKFDIENLNIGDLGKMVDGLNEQVNLRDKEINHLKFELANNDAAFSSLDYHLELLSDVNNEQAKKIEMQEKQLNTAWYLFGSYKFLKEKGIITKEKGFIKLRKAKKLGGDFDRSLFTEIDIREQKSFEINGHKPRLLTSHPKESYLITEKNGKIHLEITDIYAFWNATKYLVIVLDQHK